MANLALRNPQFKSIATTIGAKSVVLRLTIDGVLRYTLVKNIKDFVTGQPATNFDIAELARDYLEIEEEVSYIPQYVEIETELKSYDDFNGNGDVVDSPPVEVDKGFEAYGTFTDGSNPEIPFRITDPSYLISNNEINQFNQENNYTILAPTGEGGKIPSITSLGGFVANNYTGTDTSVTTVDGVVCNIKRIDCTKYGVGRKVLFINKYGAQQDLWFFLKDTRSLARTNESYKANIIQYAQNIPATYNPQKATNKVFNTQGKQSYTLSSGYYPEFANKFFEELLLSEYVWLGYLTPNPNKGYFFLPVKVKTSSVSYKTSVNDRLVEYTIEFEDAYDYINNIR